MPTIRIIDQSGNREVFHPEHLGGELWMNGEYCGQFIIYEGEILLINHGGLIQTYISWINWVGDMVGRG